MIIHLTHGIDRIFPLLLLANPGHQAYGKEYVHAIAPVPVPQATNVPRPVPNSPAPFPLASFFGPFPLRAGLRANRGKKLRKARRVWHDPIVQTQDDKRMVRMRAYVERQEAEKLAAEGKDVPVELQESVKHAGQLDTVDEQKLRLREKGHFFFVHPNNASAEEAFPVVEPTNLAPYVAPKHFRREASRAAAAAAGMADEAPSEDEGEEEGGDAVKDLDGQKIAAYTIKSRTEVYNRAGNLVKVSNHKRVKKQKKKNTKRF